MERLEPKKGRSPISSLNFERKSDFKKFLKFIKNETEELKGIVKPKRDKVKSILGVAGTGLGIFGIGSLLLGQTRSDEFEKGEIVWSATHHAPAQVMEKQTKQYQDSKKGLTTVDYEEKYGCDCYSIYVRQKPSGDLEDFFNATGIGGYYSYSLASDLGKLTHLEEYGIDLSKL